MRHGIVVVIVRSDAGGNGRKTTLILGCERSGTYKPYKNQLIRKGTETKKCDCPFRLRGRPVSTVQLECDEVLRRFEELDLSGKVVLKSKMREVAFPETTSMCPPPEKIKTKGRWGKGKVQVQIFY
ncbi:otubain [Sesbania bispinosa]|nr:otubain [Sesbania bispinosa]